SELRMQASVSIYLVCYGLSQLFVGVLLDSFGRFKIGLGSLLLFSLACFAIAIFPSINLIYFFRGIQGICIGAVLVAKRAYFVDIFEGEKLKHSLSLLAIIWSVGPITAPFIGGHIQTNFGWKYNFYFLGLASLIGFMLDFIYGGETLQSPLKFHLNNIVENYKNMLGTFDFILAILLSSLAYSVALIFTLTSPFLIEHSFHYSSVTVGYSLLIIGIAWMAGNFLGKMLIKIDSSKTVLFANMVQFILIIVMFVSFRFVQSLYTLIGFTFFTVMMSAFIFNNYFTYGLSRFPKTAGLAGGLVGGLMYIFLSSITYLLLLFIPVKELLNLAEYYIILITGINIALISFLRVKRKRVVFERRSDDLVNEKYFRDKKGMIKQL
ncbi:MAG TPA: MFS transporter, partial [Bacteroidales bacterium]